MTAWTLVRAVLVAVATGAIGSLYPAWRVTRLRPAECKRFLERNGFYPTEGKK